jgi:hypothetical protein
VHVAAPDLLVALGTQWDRVVAVLKPITRESLVAAVLALAEMHDDAARRAQVTAISRLLLDALPKGDPLIPLIEEARLVATKYQPLITSIAQLRAKVGVPWQAESRILGCDWQSATVLRDRGIDPDLPDLIRLDRPDGTHAVPMFQFAADGSPRPVVLRVNQVLGAVHDPWGAADWWLTGNVWLHETPESMSLRADTTADLLAAAVAAVEG